MVDVAFGAKAVAHFVAGPGEAAELQILVGMGQVDEGFEGAGFLQAFDEGVAVEEERGEEGFHGKLEGSVGLVGLVGSD